MIPTEDLNVVMFILIRCKMKLKSVYIILIRIWEMGVKQKFQTQNWTLQSRKSIAWRFEMLYILWK